MHQLLQSLSHLKLFLDVWDYVLQLYFHWSLFLMVLGKYIHVIHQLSSAADLAQMKVYIAILALSLSW